MFKQTKALSPESFLSEALVKTAAIQETPANQGAATAPTGESVKDLVAEPAKTVDATPAEETSPVLESTLSSKVVNINTNADPLNNPKRQSMFKSANPSKIESQPQSTSHVARTESPVEAPKSVAVRDGAVNAGTGAKPIASTATSKPVNPEPVERKRTLADVAKQNKEAKSEGFDAKIVLNTFKVYEPAISAAIFALGDASGPKAEKSIKVIVERSESLKNELCKIVGVDPLDPDKQWVVSNLRLTAMTHVSTAFKRNPDPDNFVCDSFIEAFESVQSSFAVEPEKTDFPEMTDSLRVKLSVMKSLNPVIKEYGLFENVLAGMVPGFTIDRAAIFEHAAAMMQENSSELVKLAGVDKNDSGMLITYQSMLNLSGTVMSNCIAFACDRMLEHLDTLKPDQRKIYVDSQISSGNLAVIDLQVLEKTFSETMVALSQIVKASPLIYATKTGPRP